MLRVPVVDDDLFARSDGAEREEGDLVARHDAQVGVGRARVIDKGCLIATLPTIDGEVIVEPNELGGIWGPQAGLDPVAPADKFARVERNLLARRKMDERAAAPSVDAALPNL